MTLKDKFDYFGIIISIYAYDKLVIDVFWGQKWYLYQIGFT